MLCAVVTGPSFNEIQAQIEYGCRYADALELRWDCFDSLDFKISCPLPMVFTLRPLSQGGFFSGNEESRLNQLEQLLIDLNPDFVDLEHIVSNDTLRRFKKYRSKIILSYHNFDHTPNNLFQLFENLKKMPADYYKIATMANSTLDALRMLNFIKKADSKLIGLCMGEFGTITRILNHWSYAIIDESQPVAKGQLSLKTLTQRYRFKTLNQETAIFGLIGDPIDKSVSHITHNKVFAHFDQAAVYVKMRITKDELDSFFEEIKTLNFKGLSVTMPLKESVIAYLDKVDQKALSISAVNTIVINHQKKFGFNTDCTGALKAINEQFSVTNKKILILGAGGAARAIAKELVLDGADVTILNRSPKRAIKMADDFGCKAKSLSDIASLEYDLLINTTPDEMPIPASIIREKSFIMDIKSVPKWTELLIAANKKNCGLIFGYKMFVYQAIDQFELWSNSLTYCCKKDLPSLRELFNLSFDN